MKRRARHRYHFSSFGGPWDLHHGSRWKNWPTATVGPLVRRKCSGTPRPTWAATWLGVSWSIARVPRKVLKKISSACAPWSSSSTWFLFDLCNPLASIPKWWWLHWSLGPHAKFTTLMDVWGVDCPVQLWSNFTRRDCPADCTIFSLIINVLHICTIFIHISKTYTYIIHYYTLYLCYVFMSTHSV